MKRKRQFKQISTYKEINEGRNPETTPATELKLLKIPHCCQGTILCTNNKKYDEQKRYKIFQVPYLLRWVMIALMMEEAKICEMLVNI